MQQYMHRNDVKIIIRVGGIYKRTMITVTQIPVSIDCSTA